MHEDTAHRGIRALCRYFGGQLLYVPSNKTDGFSAHRIRAVLSGEIGDTDAEKILEKLMALYGGAQVYIPLEKTGFAQEVAREIYERYNGTTESMNELCRNYRLSFAQVYRSIHDAREAMRCSRGQDGKA